MKILLLLTVISSCSLLENKVQFNKEQKLLQSIQINKSSKDSVVFIARQILKDNISNEKFRIVLDELSIYKYNSKILSKSKIRAESKNINKTYSKIVNSPLFLQIEQFKLKKIEKDYHQYLKTFFNNKRNTKRLDLIRSIIDIDFPSMNYIDLIAQTTALSTKYDNLYDQINYYSAVKNFLTSSLYNVNVYLYKNTSTELLLKLYEKVNTQQYKETRKFVEDIQMKIHNDILRNITRKLNKSRLIYGDIYKIKKGAS